MHVAVERVGETRQAFRFNPMPARERRIIHLGLKDHQPGIRTACQGTGDERQIVATPLPGSSCRFDRLPRTPGPASGAYEASLSRSAKLPTSSSSPTK